METLRPPNSQESISNINFGLVDSKIDTNHIAKNLDILISDVQKVNGNVIQLGITVDQLKQVYGKIAGRNNQFGEGFPFAQMDALNKIIGKAETLKAEEAQNPSQGAEVVNLGQESAAIAMEIKHDSERSLSRLVAIKLKNDLDFNPMDIAFIQKKKNEKGYPQNLSEKPLTIDESNKLFEAIQTKIRQYEESQKQQLRRAA